MRRKCLITGASGNLGRDLIDTLGDTFDVVGLCHQNGESGLLSLDIRDSASFGAVLNETCPDIVVHSAAYRDPDFCENHREETWRLNVEPIRTICEHMPLETKVVLISSDYVFDGMKPPYRESDPTSPVNVYGESKVAAEGLLVERPGSLVLRAPLLVRAGATLTDSGFVGHMMKALRSPGPVELDHVLMRFPVWTRDVAVAVSFLLTNDFAGIFHAGGPGGGTIYEWTLRLGDLLGMDTGHLQPTEEVVVRRAARPMDSHLDTGKIEQAGFCAFTPFSTFAPAILRTVGLSL